MREAMSINVPAGHTVEQYMRPKMRVMRSQMINMERVMEATAGTSCTRSIQPKSTGVRATAEVSEAVTMRNIVSDRIMRVYLSSFGMAIVSWRRSCG